MIKSTILIKGATRERLKHRGVKGETYDNLINRLLDDEEEKSESSRGEFETKGISGIII